MNYFKSLSLFDKEGRCLIQGASEVDSDGFVDKDMKELIKGQEKL